MGKICKGCGCEVDTVYSGGLCSDCWHEKHPNAFGSKNVVDISWLFLLPIKLAKWLVIKPCWWLTKKLVPAICKACWWCCKKTCTVCWLIAKNKWVWTICTCGASWVTWKFLNAIYAPKPKKAKDKAASADVATESDDDEESDDEE